MGRRGSCQHHQHRGCHQAQLALVWALPTPGASNPLGNHLFRCLQASWHDPGASKTQLGFGTAHPGASKPLSAAHPGASKAQLGFGADKGAKGPRLDPLQPHSPRPEVKRSCRTPCRTEGARVRLTKALTFSLSTKPSHESCCGCSGSEGSASGWGEETGIRQGSPHTGGVTPYWGAPRCPHSTPALSNPQHLLPAPPKPAPMHPSTHTRGEGGSRCFQPEI